MHVKFFSLFVALMLFVPFGGTVFASDEAWDLLVKAVENGGDNPALLTSASAEFRVETTTLRDNKTTKTQKQIKVLLSGNNKLCTGTSPEKCKRRLETTENPDYLEGMTWITQTIERGSPNKPDSYLAFEWKPGQSLLSRFRGQGDARNIPEIQRFGRFYCMPGLVSRVFLEKLKQANNCFSDTFLTEFKNELKNQQQFVCEIVGEAKDKSGNSLKVIEIKQNGLCCEKYHIDPSRGYVCPYAWMTDPAANFTMEIIALNYLQEKRTSLYYPEYCQISTKTVIGEQIQEYFLTPNTLQLNQRIPDNEFAIDIPEDAYVHDLVPYDPLSPEGLKQLNAGVPIQREIIPYRAIKKGRISFAKGEFEIEQLKWLQNAIPVVGEEAMREQAYNKPVSHVRWLFIAGGIVLIIIGLYPYWKRRAADHTE